MADITLKIYTGHFCYRVGAIIINDNKLLMVKNSNSPYYYSVGGRVKFGETSESAVLREVYEETQINMEIDRLAFIHENFFTADFMDNSPFHEISFFFLMKPSDDIKNIKCESLGMDGGTESLHWLRLEGLSKYEVYPQFFKSELLNLSDKVGHFSTIKGNTCKCL